MGFWGPAPTHGVLLHQQRQPASSASESPDLPRASKFPRSETASLLGLRRAVLRRTSVGRSLVSVNAPTFRARVSRKGATRGIVAQAKRRCGFAVPRAG